MLRGPCQRCCAGSTSVDLPCWQHLGNTLNKTISVQSYKRRRGQGLDARDAWSLTHRMLWSAPRAGSSDRCYTPDRHYPVVNSSIFIHHNAVWKVHKKKHSKNKRTKWFCIDFLMTSKQPMLFLYYAIRPGMSPSQADNPSSEEEKLT